MAPADPVGDGVGANDWLAIGVALGVGAGDGDTAAEAGVQAPGLALALGA
ncbi:MAG: hypothetical protein ACHQZR_01750 [Candidatus Limnocylindrales bacterium]